MSKITQERRNELASDNVPRAIKILANADFRKYTGTGFNVHITYLDGVSFCPEFVINGEEMQPVADTLVRGMQDALTLRKSLLLAAKR